MAAHFTVDGIFAVLTQFLALNFSNKDTRIHIVQMI